MARLGDTDVEVIRIVHDEPMAEICLSLTVRKHLENAFAKLGVHTRGDAVALAGPFLSAPGVPYRQFIAA